MLEWLAATTGIELGKLVLEQVLDLSKPVLEGYVQDFFKDCLSSGVSRLNATALKIPMAEAVGYFIKRFIKELQINDVPETSIQHHYKAAIKEFVQDKAVRPILGTAFEKDCKQIDYGQLEQIWAQQYQGSGWQFPSEEFDWRGVCKEYVYEVKGIVKANPELREILNSDLLEDIARNTAQLSPGFDVETYRASLQSSYGYLKLYTLDSTDRVDAIKLWAMFIEQTVREALPPMRYDLPSDLKRQLQDRGQLEADLSPEALEHYRHEYFQQPARKVLEAVADSQRAVILGDPGSGKSSLLQYLALEWVEGNTEKLPLLIELREFALNPSASFLEFMHRGRGVDWQFDQQQLHQHLLKSPTLVMFDGLDEVFDRATQSTVIDDIIRFSQQYPKAQVLVTSRIIGYNPDRLQHSGFRHFTIQSLDTDEIHEFIDRWYDLSMGSDPDKVRLKQRLQEAIANSKAIANLADNPLLVTMMAILNRRQELPRDRADLYDQASRVLLYHWDVDHKRLQIPMDAIGRREKQEMLRLIAHEMQAGEEGLKGNLISAERLTRILTDYLRDQGFSEPREKANRLIQQLRERNFILCYRGADTYGFMHRTFLEYFCAVEIVHHFEKQRTLTFEQLRDQVFGQHWQDETWHEVLRLICGAIDPKFAAELIEFLMTIEVNKSDFLENEKNFIYEDYRLKIESIGNLLLAAECLSEITSRSVIANTEKQLLDLLKQEIELEQPYLFSNEAAKGIIRIFAATWGGDAEILSWIKFHLRNIKQEGSYFLTFLARMLAQGWKDHPDTLSWVKMQVYQAEYKFLRQQSIWALAEGWKDTSDTLDIVKDRIQNDEDSDVRSGAIRALANVWRHEPQTLAWLKSSAQSSSDNLLQYFSVREIARCYSNHPETFDFLVSVVLSDQCTNSEINPRTVALQGLCRNYSTHLRTIELLRDRAINDSDEQLREWAQEQLHQMENQGGAIEWT
ncbi:HEAT repeat domain-containing protein [Nodosilinea sp. P-1105]|uniref:NACHT domain-containing protein n=1 Tax=Nodosilinea sp. P-1105 TaxID=2546229 RepID=UPI00146F40FB|nr:HEAT repeat domain-containing protein [Nodosilinea sp. P-1105]NMF82529.1 NACHT domain-containing protein [Nodosilinea sp. P-1105]